MSAGIHDLMSFPKVEQYQLIEGVTGIAGPFLINSLSSNPATFSFSHLDWMTLKTGFYAAREMTFEGINYLYFMFLKKKIRKFDKAKKIMSVYS